MKDLFKKSGINPSLIKALEKQNIVSPTEVQEKVLPEATLNKDLIVQSETGTGKTLAFLLPLFKKIDPTIKEMQSLILVPTHELALQIQRQIELLSQNSEVKITSTPIIGNVNIDRQIDKLKEKPNIIVGSPGRILELIKKKKISAHTVKTIILDEADRLLDIHNIENVKAIIKSTLKERQLLIFSASITKNSIEIAKELMKEPEIIKTEGKSSIPDTIEHLYFLAEHRDKMDVLRKLIRIMNPKKALAFVSNGDELSLLVEKLKFHKVNAEGIQGASFKLERKKVMDDFRNGKLQLLVATDIAARGIDIDDLTHIYNINMPEQANDYLHRAGRTGRKGNKGVCVSIVTPREIELIKQFNKRLNIEFIQKDLKMGEIVDIKKQEHLKPKSTNTNSTDKKIHTPGKSDKKYNRNSTNDKSNKYKRFDSKDTTKRTNDSNMTVEKNTNSVRTYNTKNISAVKNSTGTNKSRTTSSRTFNSRNNKKY